MTTPPTSETFQAAWGDTAAQNAIAEQARRAMLDSTRRFLERVDVKALDELRKSLELPPEALGALIEIHAKKLDDSESSTGLRAAREILPISSGHARVKPGVSVSITARPQRVAFRPERLFVSNACSENKGVWWKRLSPWYRAPQGHGAADWVIDDITIGGRSQFAQAGSVPGDMFACNAIDSFISFETAQTAMDVTITATYIGPNRKGEPFYGSMLGTAALGNAEPGTR